MSSAKSYRASVCQNLHMERANTLRPRQNGQDFAGDNFKRMFLNKNIQILIKISLKFVPNGLIDNIPALVQIMAWDRTGDKPLSEPMMSWIAHTYLRHSALMIW